MTDRHAFLAAIKANPDDDTPRLLGMMAAWQYSRRGMSLDFVRCYPPAEAIRLWELLLRARA